MSTDEITQIWLFVAGFLLHGKKKTHIFCNKSTLFFNFRREIKEFFWKNLKYGPKIRLCSIKGVSGALIFYYKVGAEVGSGTNYSYIKIFFLQ